MKKRFEVKGTRIFDTSSEAVFVLSSIDDARICGAMLNELHERAEKAKEILIADMTTSAHMTTPLGMLPIDSYGMRKLVDALAVASAKIEYLEDQLHQHQSEPTLLPFDVERINDPGVQVVHVDRGPVAIIGQWSDYIVFAYPTMEPPTVMLTKDAEAVLRLVQPPEEMVVKWGNFYEGMARRATVYDSEREAEENRGGLCIGTFPIHLPARLFHNQNSAPQAPGK